VITCNAFANVFISKSEKQTGVLMKNVYVKLEAVNQKNELYTSQNLEHYLKDKHLNKLNIIGYNMKWKHKQTGWEAKTHYYEFPDQGVIIKYKVGDNDVSFNLPLEIVQADENWEEVDDDRWLRLRLTAREFMEAFAMTIDPSGCNHDSLVVKQLIDRMYVSKKEYKIK